MFYTNTRSPVNPDRGFRATLGAVNDEKHSRFIAGGPRRARAEGEGFWAFLRGWIASLFSVDRRM
jgi:hypothetical protein